MFLKFSAVTILISIALTVYIKQYNPEFFMDVHNFCLHWLKKRNIDSGHQELNEALSELFTVDELKLYNGEPGSKGLCLAILGKVYDVESGLRHYGPGGGYHFFTGRDGSRAFVSGDFTEEGLTDDVLGLSTKEIKSIVQWEEFYRKDYKYRGKLIGRYFDSNGDKTDYHRQIDELIEDGRKEEESEHNEKLLFPPCNSEWSRESGSRVWCSKMSGGIDRDWVGVPRQVYIPGSSSYRCACIRTTNAGNSAVNAAQMKEFPNCHPDSISCQVTN